MKTRSDALHAFHAAREAIAGTLVAELEIHPAARAAFGDRAHDQVAAGVSFTLEALDTACQFEGSPYIENQFKWLRGNVPHQAVPLDLQRANLRLLLRAVRSTLPEQHARVLCRVIRHMQRQHSAILG